MRTLFYLAALGLALSLWAAAVGADGTIPCSQGGKKDANYDGSLLWLDINSWNTTPTVSSPQLCCKTCEQFPGCNMWNYCKASGGCNGNCQNYVDGLLNSANDSQRFGPNGSCVKDAPDNFPEHTCTLKHFDKEPATPADYGNRTTSNGWLSGTTYTPNDTNCHPQQDYSYTGKYIDKSYQPTPESCCTWCSQLDKCATWTWRGEWSPDPDQSFTCYGKQSMQADGATSCVTWSPGQNLTSGMKVNLASGKESQANYPIYACPSSSSHTGAIIGGVVGGVVFIAAIAAGFVAFRLHRRRQADKRSALPTSAVHPADGSPAGQPGKGMASSPPRSSASVSYGSVSAGVSTSAGSDALLRQIKNTVAHSASASAVSLAPWQLDFRDIELERRIGGGAYGAVYRAKWHETPVAVKVLLGQRGDGSGVSGGADTAGKEPAPLVELERSRSVITSLKQEAKMMSTLHHPNVVQFLGMTETPAAIVSELCARGSLLDVLRAARDKPAKAAELTWPRRVSMAHDASLGMIYLHSRTPPIIHRDLKSPNLLVTGDYTVKVADFGLSKVMQESSHSTSAGAENPRWLAPEVLRGESAAPASDVFAFGVVLWELLTWELPWGAVPNHWSIALRLQKGERPALPPREKLPGPGSGEWAGLDAYLSLMQRCWAQDPAERPTFQEVVAELRQSDPGGASEKGPASYAEAALDAPASYASWNAT